MHNTSAVSDFQCNVRALIKDELLSQSVMCCRENSVASLEFFSTVKCFNLSLFFLLTLKKNNIQNNTEQRFMHHLPPFFVSRSFDIQTQLHYCFFILVMPNEESSNYTTVHLRRVISALKMSEINSVALLKRIPYYSFQFCLICSVNQHNYVLDIFRIQSLFLICLPECYKDGTLLVISRSFQSAFSYCQNNRFYGITA